MSLLCPNFASICLRINWAKGKTEAMLMLRKRVAVVLHAGLVVEGKRALQLEAGPVLHLVTRYKHLGSHLARSAAPGFEIRNSASQAGAAYAPIATIIVGCPWLEAKLKVALGDSLVCSHFVLQHCATACSYGCIQEQQAHFL